MRNNCNSYITNFLFFIYPNNVVKNRDKDKDKDIDKEKKKDTFNYLEPPCIQNMSPKNENTNKYIDNEYDYPTDSEIYDMSIY
jgi:hypothetical protein